MNHKPNFIKFVCSAIFCLIIFAGTSSAKIPSEHFRKIENAVPSKATVCPQKPRTLLVFTLCKGYKHSSIPYCTGVLEMMGKRTGAFKVIQSKDMSVFKPGNLAKFDAVCFNNTTKLDFSDPLLRKSLMDFVKNGGGIVGIHAATDNFYNWPEAAEMMGGLFDGHPWHEMVTIKVDDPCHPVNSAFDGKSFEVSDEIYQFKAPYSRNNVHVLLSLDTNKTNMNKLGIKRTDNDFAVSWIQNYEKGRIFYCSLGHDPHIYWNPAILRHFLDGIQFAMGDLQTDTALGNSELQALDGILAEIADYDYGKSRKPLIALDDFVRDAQTRPELSKQIEGRLLELLRSDATTAGKQFVCRKLRIIGSKKAVPTLAAMLTEPAISDTARYALERIPGTIVNEALREALTETSGKTKAGIINSIAQRRDGKSVPILCTLIYDSDPTIAAAAVSALGKIAGLKASKALAEAVNKTTGKLRTDVFDAYLCCADRLAAESRRNEAMVIYKRLYSSQEDTSIRIAALRGMAIAAPASAKAGIIVNAIRDNNPQVRAAGTGLVRKTASVEITKAVIAEMPSLPVKTKVQLLSALAESRDAAALPAVITAAKSKEASVRIEALNTLGQLGDVSTVTFLAKTAAEAKGTESQTASESLYSLSAANVDRTILANIPDAEPEVKIELVRSVNKRRINSATDTLLESVDDPDSKVRLESIRVLRVIAKEKDLPKLIDTLMQTRNKSERREAERTVAAVANKIDDSGRRADAVLAVLPLAEQIPVECSLLRVLGQVGGNKALNAVRSALREKNPEVQRTAIDVLSNWQGPEPMAELLEIAQNRDNKIHQVLALRGFVRLIGLDVNRPPTETIKMYRQAMSLAPNANEKKMVLSGLGEVKSLSSFQMAVDYLEDKAAQQEAAIAVVKIAPAVFADHRQKTMEVLGKVLQISKSDSLRKEAKKIINQITNSLPEEEQKLGFEPIFDGNSLLGWKRHEGLPGDGVAGSWTVEDGAIVGCQEPPGAGGLLRTLRTFKDFELRLEAKIDWPFDSGIFLRAGPDGKSHQVTLDWRAGGEIGAIYLPWTEGFVHHCPEGIKYFKKDGWNYIRIICQGEPALIWVWINNIEVTDFQHTEKTTSGVPKEGTICLQIHPGGKGFEKSKVRFRAIRIREF